MSNCEVNAVWTSEAYDESVAVYAGLPVIGVVLLCVVVTVVVLLRRQAAAASAHPRTHANL